MEEARRAFDDDGAPKGSATAGSRETTAALRLSPHLSAYAAAHPEVDVILRTGTACELIKKVLEFRMEGAFVCGPVDHPDPEETLGCREALAALKDTAVRDLDELLGRSGSRLWFCAPAAPTASGWKASSRAVESPVCAFSSSERSRPLWAARPGQRDHLAAERRGRCSGTEQSSRGP
ncbi:MAG: LysR substrate-binding domain-containing protein [Methylocella sp.]